MLCAVVGQGQVVEMGSYAELAAAGGAFTSLMKIQMMGHEGDAAASAAEDGASPEAREVAELARLSSGVQGDVKVVDHPSDKVRPASDIVSHRFLPTQASRTPARDFLVCIVHCVRSVRPACCMWRSSSLGSRMPASTSVQHMTQMLMMSTRDGICWFAEVGPAITGSCMAWSAVP